jgi:hypothetical protein
MPKAVLKARPSWWLVIAPALLLAPVWAAGKALYWGTPALQFHPWRVAAWRMLQRGVMPLWNPDVGLGAPLLANYQSGLLYPPNWLYFGLAALGGEPAMAWGMAPIVVLHWVLAGWGMKQLLAALELRYAAQIVGGLSFGLSGYLVARAGFLSINAAAAWLPWLLWATYKFIQAAGRAPWMNSWAWLARLSLFTALLLLAGHAQTAWYALVFLAAWALFWLTQQTRSPAHSHKDDEGKRKRIGVSWRTVWVLGAAIMMGALLAAAQLLPTAELLLQSARGDGADLDFVMTYSFWPWRLSGLIAPDFFGSPVSGDYWGFGNYWEDAIYVGLLPLVFAIRAIVKPRKTRWPALARFSSWTVLSAFLLALGQNTPLFPFLYRYVPTFDLFQAPTRIMYIGLIGLVLLIALGLDGWEDLGSNKTRRWLQRTLAAAMAALLAAGALVVLDLGVDVTFVRATALSAFLACIAIGVLLNAPRHDPLRSSRWTWMLVSFVAVDLLIAGWGLNPGIDLDFYAEQQAEAAPADEESVQVGYRSYYSADLVYENTFQTYFRFDAFEGVEALSRTAALPNLDLLNGTTSLNNFDPLLSERYVWFMELLEASPTPERESLLNYASVGVVDETILSANALPRLRWSACAQPAGSLEQAWRKTWTEPDPEFSGMLVLERYTTNAQWVCGSEAGLDAQAVSVLASDRPGLLEIQVEAESSGWLLIADGWYPGWRAEVNGQVERVHPADGLMMAVRTPSGSSEIVLRYAPASFRLGMGLSGVGALLWLSLSLTGRRRGES